MSLFESSRRPGGPQQQHDLEQQEENASEAQFPSSHSKDVHRSKPPNYPAPSIPGQYTVDRTRPWTKHVAGYPRYSAFIASDEDKSTTIFRRFQRLSTRNLLYFESELSELEAIQDRLDQEAKRDEDLELSAQSWELLRLQAEGGCAVPIDNYNTKEGAAQNERNVRLQEAAQERYNVALRIRAVLIEYQTALKLENDILALKPPDRRPLKGVRRIFYTSHNTPGARKVKSRGKEQLSGSGAGMIAGKISTHLDPTNEQDLCVLAPTVQKDRLTRLFEGKFSYFFRTRTPDGLSNFVSHSKVSLAVTILSALMAVIFLIGAVVGLYWVENPKTKLGILSGLTVAFAGTLALFTNARRQDVFAATAAYAAVLVVFISGNLTTGKVDESGLSTTPMPSSLPSTVTLTHLIVTTLISSTAQTILVTTTSIFPTTLVVTGTQNLTSTSPVVSPSNPPSAGLSTGAKAGIGVGASIGGLSLISALLVLCVRGRKHDAAPQEVLREEVVVSHPRYMINPMVSRPASADGPPFPPAELGSR